MSGVRIAVDGCCLPVNPHILIIKVSRNCDLPSRNEIMFTNEFTIPVLKLSQKLPNAKHSRTLT